MVLWSGCLVEVALATSLGGWPVDGGDELHAPTDLEVGDLDGDGDEDLVLAQADPNYPIATTVFHNEGDGTLTPVLELHEKQSHVDLGDMDGDGDLDLVFAGDYYTGIEVWRNDGLGGFTLAYTGPDAEDVVWGDADGDGDLDLALAGDTQPNQVLRNNGVTFVSVWSGPSERTRSVEWVDLDLDGVPEVSWGNASSGPPSHVDRISGATLVPVWTEAVGDRSTVEQAYADFDGDGWMDAAFLGTDLVLYRNVLGVLVEASAIPWSATPYGTHLDVGDDDGDGDLDLLLSKNPYDPFADRILANDGNGTFSESWSSRIGSASNDVAFVELNGDGIMDHVSVTFEGFDLYFGGPVGVVCDGRSSTVGLESGGPMAFGDMDGDGDLDLAVATSSGVDVFENRASRYSFYATVGNQGPYNDLLWTDVDTDGDPDLVAIAGYDDLYSFVPSKVFENDGTGRMSLLQTLTAEYSLGADVADVDGDGDEDLLVANSYNCAGGCMDGRERLYRNDAGVYVSAWRGSIADDSYDVAFTDVDGDGDPDFYAGNDGYDRLWINNGVGQFAAVWQAPTSGHSTSVAWADFDQDGDPDIAVSETAGGPRIYENTGVDLVLSWIHPSADRSDHLVVGDWDGDTHPDLAWTSQPAFSDPLPVALSEVNANHTFTDLPLGAVVEALEVSFADVDGEGAQELIAQPLGAAVSIFGAGDRDGDGTLDACEPLHVAPPTPLSGTAEVSVWNTNPVADVYLVGGTALGSTPVPGCPGLSVGLRSATILRHGPSGSDGTWAGSVGVPPGLPPGAVGYLQAVDRQHCEVGDLLQVTLP